MKSSAEKMGIQSKELEYRLKWGEAQFPAFQKKLKPGNSLMMKQLLEWAIKEKVDGIPDAQELAKNLTLTSNPTSTCCGKFSATATGNIPSPMTIR